MENYREVTEWLFNQLPMYQRQGKAAYKDNLNNTYALDDYFGNPHHTFKSVHVAGTNGKGSVSHMIASVLQESGYRVGLYTSPHLKDFRERIKVNGQLVGETFVVDFVKDNKEIIEQLKPSFFELTVAMAFKYFADQKVDVAVIEVGMGGRLDSTNIITPEISVITNIGLDHIQFLGDTPEKIAIEKGGIIKPGVPVVVGEKQKKTEEVFRVMAKEKNSQITFAEDVYSVGYGMLTVHNTLSLNIKSGDEITYMNLEVDQPGLYQMKNVVTALVALEKIQKTFPITEKNIREGLKEVKTNTGLLGRWQMLSANPHIICDIAHNEDGLSYVAEQIRQTPHKKLHMVLGMVNDKRVDDILSFLPDQACYYFTKADIPRALDEQELMARGFKAGLKGMSYPTVKMALDAAKKRCQKDDLIFVGGSTFVVAEVV